MKYLVYQVGCIECGVTSYPIKMCATLEEAKKVAFEHPSTWDSEGGEGFVTIINLETCENVERYARPPTPKSKYAACPKAIEEA